jgi:hypothetical protein
MAFAFDRPSRRTDRFGNVGSNQGYSSDKANRRTQGNATMWPVTALSVC